MTRTWSWLWLAGCTPTPVAAPMPTPIVLEGPALQVSVPGGPVQTGALVRILANATDPDGVDALELHARVEGQLAFTRIEMQPTSEGFVAEVPSELVTAPGVEVWVRGYDASDWRVPSEWPVDGARLPARIAVRPIAVDLPLFESFEGTFSNAFGLYERGWNDAALGFRGQRWRIGTEGSSGDSSALHRAGYAGIEPVDDWLVSPTLDLTSVLTAEVRWMERGARVDRADHSLWISLGSPIPEAGDFVELATLAPPPEGRWAVAPVIDLSAYVGQRITLAWRYRGGDTDEWALDDVAVRVFAPDVRVVDVVAPFLRPGDVGALQVTVENRGAPTLEPVALQGVAVDGYVGFNQSQSLGLLDTNEAVVVDLPVAVASQQPDNTLVQADLTLMRGATSTQWPASLQIGHPTRGLVRIQTSAAGAVDLRVGTGDPRLPHAEEVVYQGTLQPGVYTLAVDLGDHVAYLPSEPGRLRWWTRATTAHPTLLLGFGIDFDGTTRWSAATGRFRADTPYYLPHRPDLRVTAVEVLDPPLRPGEPATLRVGLRNRGGPASGPVTVWPRSTHPGLAVPSTSQTADVSTLTTVDIDVAVNANHTNSTPVSFALDVQDGVEGYTLDTSVDVPWPAIVAGSVFVGADGVFDPNETTDVLFLLRNDGALPSGPLTCTLTSTSTAVVVSDPFDVELEAGAFQLAPATLTDVGGSVGDTLTFSLTCVGDLGSWTLPLSVGLGGVPWIVLPIDPAGDALPGASFDFREARWRYDSGVLAVEFTMAAPIGPNPALELWMDNPGSTYWNHVVVLSATGAELYGVRQAGWTLLSEPEVTVLGSTLTLTLEEAEMDLTNTELAIAVGTGFCGAVSFHCDQWPDGWGNPYIQPLDITGWPVLDWP